MYGPILVAQILKMIKNTKNDQKRIMKPEDAFAAGSDWLVIGRSITKGNIKKNIQNLLEILED